MERKPPVEMHTMTKSAPSSDACEVGRGGDRRLGAHGLVELVGQRLHFGQRRGVDVLEDEVHAGQGRRPEEVGHQLRSPLVAPAADDRHLGRHAATVQSRSMVRLRRRAPWALAAAFLRQRHRAPGPPAVLRVDHAAGHPRGAPHQPHLRQRAWSSSSAPSAWSGARAGPPPPASPPWPPCSRPTSRWRSTPGRGATPAPSDSRAVAWGRLPLQLLMAWAALPGPPRRRPDD